MKSIKFKINKELLDKVRDEVNLILFNIKGFGFEDMKIINNILRGLENVKFKVNYN